MRRRALLPILAAALAVAGGQATAGAGRGHEAREAALVTVELTPGLDASTQKTVDLAPGVAYTFTVSGTVTVAFSSLNICVLDAFYQQCNGGATSLNGSGITISSPPGAAGQPLADLANPRPAFDPSHTYTFTHTRPAGFPAQSGLWAAPAGAPFATATYSGGFSVTVEGAAPAPPPDPCAATGNAREAQVCPRTARVVRIGGEVAARRGTGSFRILRPGDEVAAGEELFTGVDSTITLGLDDGSTFVLRELTQMLLRTILFGDRRQVEVQLKVGRIKADVKKETAFDTNFEIVTPTATAGVRGTVFTVAYDPTARATLVTTQQGSVAVDPVAPRLSTALVGAGREVEVTPRAITRPGPVGRAGARGGVNRFAALALVTARVARGRGPCGATIPRGRASAVRPAPGGWRVSVALQGRLRGSSLWTVSGRRVAPANVLAGRLQSRCR